MKAIVISLGSNVGDRHGNIDEARKLLEERGIRVVESSHIYESEPVGFTGQDDFLNQVIAVETSLTPQELLVSCLGVEEHMGRIRTVKNGPRIIDIDILFYADEVISEETLLLPHPRIAERRFILVPLAELLPQEEHPIMGETIQSLLDQCEDFHRVELSA